MLSVLRITFVRLTNKVLFVYFYAARTHYHPQAGQKSEENTRVSSDSAADLCPILFRYICTVKHIHEIIQILR